MKYAIIIDGHVANTAEADEPLDTNWIELPSGVGRGWHYDGTTFSPPAPSEPNADMVDTERDRRVAAGFTFEGKLYQSRPEDQKRIAGAALAALKAMMNGKGEGEFDWFPGVDVFAWIADDNSTTAMDAPTTFAFGEVAAGHEQAHIFAARALKDADPIPADYVDDAYWP